MGGTGAGRDRARRQGVLDRPHRTPVAVARHLVGLQAQDASAARLQVRARSATATAADVTAACAAPGGLVRTWLFRGTLHAVDAADVRWLLRLLGPRNVGRGAGRRRQLGLDDDLLRRAGPALERVLDRPRSRADVVARLARRGVAVDPAGQAPPHLLAWAAAEGLVCRGPDLDGDEPSYVRLDAWVDPDPEAAAADPEELAVRLARRYLAAYAPAGPQAPGDLAAWSGLPVGTARRALAAVAGPDRDPERELDPGRDPGPDPGRGPDPDPERELDPGRDPGPDPGRGPDPGPRSDPQPRRAHDGPVVRLLGAYDPLLLGYADRTPTVDAGAARRVNPGGGTVAPTVTVDGRVLGTWTQRRRGERIDVEVHPFARLPRGSDEALAAELADLARFLALDPGRLTVTP